MAGWVSKDVRVVLSIDAAMAMFRRAEQYDLGKGGRYDRRGAAILVWSAPLGAADVGEPRGEAHFSFSIPGPGEATIWRIGWDPREGGSEAVVWEALEGLAGRPLRPA